MTAGRGSHRTEGAPADADAVGAVAEAGAADRHLPRADVVVVAAGRSRRMAGVDKLEATVAGRPLLAWTLDRLAASPRVDRLVVVTAPERADEVRSSRWLPPAVVRVVAGGARRHESVAAGIATVAALPALEGADRPVGDDRIVLVHDGARPVVSPDLVARVVDAVAEHGAAIPVAPIVETVKRVAPDGAIEATLDRTRLAVAQTPQGATLGRFREAFARFPAAGPDEWSDEAALLEACRIRVHAIPGDSSNIKVTQPGDLARVEELLRAPVPTASGAGAGRAGPAVPAGIGFARDGHPFGPGDPLVLGGVEFPRAPRLHGHSDGDVALHAVAGALLGAAGRGDLGRLFPAGPETPRGIASAELLRGVVEELGAAGLRPGRVDLTIVGARPRLGARLDEMRSTIAALLEVDHDAVSVKASTGNLGGDAGAGRAVEAEAIATVEPTAPPVDRAGTGT